MNQFAIDVDKGLSSNPKFLSSKYFYDKNGDELFQKIMELEEYYLTKSEFEILEKYKEYLCRYFSSGNEYFQLVEFGAGDGLKTKVLLNYFLAKKLEFRYLPIDISENALNGLMQDLDSAFPQLNGYGIKDDYFSALNGLNQLTTCKVVMFLGSNIGNFTPSEASQFLSNMKKELHKGDYVLIGFDLKKDPDVILRAYNDSRGITRDFNLNLLARINRELQANFNLSNFAHHPSYNPDSGAALSHLVSTTDQVVHVAKIGKTYSFGKGERIATEISQKYSIPEIESLAHEAGFKVVENFFDSKKYFVDTLWLAE